ncbi:hypothetical protein A616_28850 [Brevibacillus brevis X23]|nr:hypothetical protein A616_28850 [Brevibacillus brevis X23]
MDHECELEKNIKKYKSLDLCSYFNNRGLTSDADYKLGFLSLGNTSLPVEQVSFANDFIYDGIPFRFNKNETGDNIELAGQLVNFPSMYIKKLHFLGVSNNGDFFDDLHFMNDKQCVGTKRLYLSNFLNTHPSFDDKSAITFTYANTRGGKRDHYKPNIWYYSIDLEEPLFFNGIKFEDNPSMHIFAITVELECLG